MNDSHFILIQCNNNYIFVVVVVVFCLFVGVFCFCLFVFCFVFLNKSWLVL